MINFMNETTGGYLPRVIKNNDTATYSIEYLSEDNFKLIINLFDNRFLFIEKQLEIYRRINKLSLSEKNKKDELLKEKLYLSVLFSQITTNFKNFYNELDEVIDIKEASKLWGLSPERIKALCQNEMIVSKKIGNSWAVFKNQSNPKKHGVK